MHAAILRARRDAGGGLVLVECDTPDAVRSTHAHPGQYVRIEAGGESGYFVLASPVGASAWEILTRAGGGVADVLLAMPVGSKISITSAAGPGFGEDSYHGLPVLIVAAGTGLAGARPLVRARIDAGDAVKTRLLLGLRSRADLPLAAEIQAWRQAGVRVVLCLSRETSAPAEDPDVALGYVQDVARRMGRDGYHALFAIGPEPMHGALRDLATEWGLSADHVRTNL